MDNNTLVAITVAVATCVACCIAVTDNRSLGRTPPTNKNVFKSNVLERALRARRTKWFHAQMRCDRASFLAVVAIVTNHWHWPLHHNTKHSITKRCALTMIYLAQGGQINQSATMLGVPKSRAVDYVNQVMSVLRAVSPLYMKMATSREDIDKVCAGFKARAGFPDVVGAIDCTLIRIARPQDYEGWYCRKNFPAVNVQAIVDHDGLFCSYSIRSGSCNDQSIWNTSYVRANIDKYVPSGKHLVGDAGYKVWKHLLAPFPESTTMSRRDRVYNKAHSRTRIVVECAFGRLKNRFQILAGKIRQKESERVVNVIVSCMLLHNILSRLNDSCVVSERLEVDDDDEVYVGVEENDVSHDIGLMKREEIADMLIARDTKA